MCTNCNTAFHQPGKLRQHFHIFLGTIQHRTLANSIVIAFYMAFVLICRSICILPQTSAQSFPSVLQLRDTLNVSLTVNDKYEVFLYCEGGCSLITIIKYIQFYF